MPTQLADLGSYDVFLQAFRQDWIARLADGQDILVLTNNNQFKYRNSDLYLVGLGPRGGALRSLGTDENYNKMKGSDQKLSFSDFKKALEREYTGAFDDWSSDLRQVVLLTSESAKSHTVEAILKRILNFEISPRWNELKDLLTNWDKTKIFRGGVQTEPLMIENYKNAGVPLGSVKPYLPGSVVRTLGL
jgi:hypothetical protein